jgi:hypothetical protein
LKIIQMLKMKTKKERLLLERKDEEPEETFGPE